MIEYAMKKIILFWILKSLCTKKIRSSRVLDVNDNDSSFFIGQIYNVERTINTDKTVVEDTTTTSKLSGLFENSDYEYVNKQEMITYISEGSLDCLNIYLKKIPNQDNYVLDIYGKKQLINDFVDKLANQKQLAILNFVTDIKLEKEEYSKDNLHFSNIDLTIKEELDNYLKLKKGSM